MAKITRKTGKTDKISGVVGAIVCGAFALFGFAIPTPGMTDSFFSPMDGAFSVFKVVWIVVCVTACVYNIFMAIKGEGIPKETVDIDSNGDPLIQVNVPDSKESKPIDFEQRLRKLKTLRDEELITEAEYKQKRDEIMNEKW